MTGIVRFSVGNEFDIANHHAGKTRTTGASETLDSLFCFEQIIQWQSIHT